MAASHVPDPWWGAEEDPWNQADQGEHGQAAATTDENQGDDAPGDAYGQTGESVNQSADSRGNPGMGGSAHGPWQDGDWQGERRAGDTPPDGNSDDHVAAKASTTTRTTPTVASGEPTTSSMSDPGTATITPPTTELGRKGEYGGSRRWTL